MISCDFAQKVTGISMTLTQHKTTEHNKMACVNVDVDVVIGTYFFCCVFPFLSIVAGDVTVHVVVAISVGVGHCPPHHKHKHRNISR